MKKITTGLMLGAVAFAMATGAKIPADAAVTAPTISLKEQIGSGQIVTGWTFQYADLQQDQELHFNVYNNDPKKSETGEWYDDFQDKEWFQSSYVDCGTDSPKDTEITIDSESLTPGTKTVVAYLYDAKAYQEALNEYNDAWNDYNQGEGNGTVPEMQMPIPADYYSPASNPITINVSMEVGIDTVVKAKSITMDMEDDNATGYEIYRKVDKKFKKIATVAKDTYTDTGLNAKTWYTYKVRPYYKDPDTGVITYGEFTTFKRITKGGSLQLKAVVQKKKNVKLTWKKVKGAKSYEIYRSNGKSKATEVSKGQKNNYTSYTLLKTVGKKKKKFVDKKTLVNESYTYIVRAVMPKKKGMKQDDTIMVQEKASANIAFEMPEVDTTYTNAYGDKTIEWQKVYGIDGYIIKKYVEVYNPDGTINDGQSDWVEVDRLEKNATRYTFVADVIKKGDGYYDTDTRYQILAYKGNVVSEEDEFNVSKELGLVDAVSATSIGNGIKVSWTPVQGAAYYKVFRVRAGSLVKDNDIGGYKKLAGAEQVSEYVGAQAPVAVNVAEVNASFDTEEPLLPNKLDPAKTYYYRNYEYKLNKFTGTSMIDYAYDIYEGSYSSTDWDDNGKEIAWKATGVSEANEAIKEGPKDGIAYQYYVVAYAADPKTEEEQINPLLKAIPGTLNVAEGITLPTYKESYMQTKGCKAIGSVNFASTIKPGKPAIKKVKATGKKTATIKIKKRISGASEYKIYRATKKKGKYMCVGTTNKLTFKDKGLTSGKTYYYKVKAVTKNASNADVDSAFSKVKKVRTK